MHLTRALSANLGNSDAEASTGRRPLTPRRAGAAQRALSTALLAVTLAMAGCSGTPDGSAADPPPLAAPSSATATADPRTVWAARCSQQVSYWVVRLQQEPDHSFDYQEMGLSGDSYEALREVIRAAGDQERSTTWLNGRSAEACAARADQAVASRRSQDGWP